MTNEDGERNSAAGEGREADAIYQHNRIVAQTEGGEVSTDGKSIFFHEIYRSENLLLPDECEFREYRIVIKKIGYATKVEGHSLEKGRILQSVSAEVVGLRQQ